MRYEVVHRTTYTYQTDVAVSHHVARLTPRTLPRQRCLRHTLELSPEPASREQRLDYFGNEACYFALEHPYRELVVTARSLVEVSPPELEFVFASQPWETVRDALHHSTPGQEIWSAREFACASPLIAREPEYAAYARASFTDGRPLYEALLDLTDRLHREFAFDPASTTVGTPVAQAFAQRRGVCQDFAHVQIACLRSLGLAARYVSGYLETLPPPGQPKLVGADASHAWLSAYCPPFGWLDLDPTNNCRPGEQHITLGWGRDFADTSPLRGVFVGSGQHSLYVGVDVNRLP